MKIRVALPAIIGLLALFVFVLAAQSAMKAYKVQREAEHFVQIDKISTSLLKSAGEWAIERGATNRSLAAAGAVSTEDASAIQARRKNADEAYQTALSALNDVQSIKDSTSAQEATEAFRELQDMRSKVDGQISKGKEARDNAIVSSWVPQITKTIDKVVLLRQTMETLERASAPDIMQLVTLRHMAAEMAEYAGRERARLSAIIEAKRPVNTSDISALSVGRGHIETAWTSISILRARDDVSAVVKAEIDAVEKAYMKDYTALRSDILAAGETGDYALDSKTYFQKVTDAINAILKMSAEMGRASSDLAANKASEASVAFLLAVSIVVLSLILSAISFWITLRRIVGPLSQMTHDMGRLADGDKTVEIQGLSRKDEIGNMA